MQKKNYLVFCVLMAALCFDTAMAANVARNVRNGDACPTVRSVPQRLPDLTLPRSGHCIFYANGELTVTGGHTTHFIPTPTAEYYADGEWHLMPMAYPHDNGFAVVLHTGEVIISGGHNEELGVGQTYTMERYVPATHSFEGFGCLDRRRVLANATLLGDGRVVIAGNHYAADAIACYDGRSQVQHVKDVAQGRANPYILPIANDDALILSGSNLHMNPNDTILVDRLKGDVIRVPLLEQWQPVFSDQPFNSVMCAMGNYTYLISAIDKNGQLGFVMASDTTFSLLPTTVPVPMRSEFGPIFYKGPAVVDSLRQRGYVIGVDSLCRHQFILSVDYAQQPAALTLYHTDSLEHATVAIPILTSDGDLLLVGGEPENNYKPLATVWCYHFGTGQQDDSSLATLHSSLSTLWLWGLLAFLGFGSLAYLIIIVRRRRSSRPAELLPPADSDDLASIANNDDLASAADKSENLMDGICQLMDNEQLYLRSELKVQDIATRLNTNSTYISQCINSSLGQSFSQFVNTYRIRHAQDMLRRQPDAKISLVASESGFSSEVSFFRNFKAITGMTPREWIGSL